MANPEHVEIVKQGVEAIRAWQNENPKVQLDLRDADLQEADLTEAKLMFADLSEADLSRAELIFADLSEAKLMLAHLREADLRGADLRGAHLSFADLREADLAGADLSRAKLNDTEFRDADLRFVGDGKWWYSLFPFYRWPFVLDGTHIRGARFSPRVADPWSVLRRNYTGAMLAFHLLFLLAFILPYLGRTLFWVGVNRMEEAGVRSLVVAVKKAADAHKDSQDPKVRKWAEKAEQFYQKQGSYLPAGVREFVENHAQRIGELEALLSEAGELADSEDFKAQEWAAQARQLLGLMRPCLDVKVSKRRVWQLVLGFDKGWGYFSLVMGLLVYNVGRAFLTYSVGLLREEEQRSGDSPGLTEYRWLFHMHQAVTMLLLVAVISFVYHAWHWLTLPVLMPA